MTLLKPLLQNPEATLNKLDKLWVSFVRMFYPANCIFCTQMLSLDERENACKNCVDHLPTLQKPLCVKCSSELAPYGPLQALCNRCLRQKTYYHRGVSIFRYENAVRLLIQRVKFGKKSWYLKAAARYLKNVETPLPLQRYDLIVPVPLDSKRRREREFNQSWILAKLLKEQKQVSVPIRNVIQKIKQTKPQSALHRDERLLNLQDVFHIKSGAEINRMKILLIDDVMTTGATLNECAKCLSEGGAERVDVLSLSRTVYQ